MEERTDRKGIGNKPQLIAERVLLLREYLCANANRTHAVRIKDMLAFSLSLRLASLGTSPIRWRSFTRQSDLPLTGEVTRRKA